jgi:hypothetical protein
MEHKKRPNNAGAVPSLSEENSSELKLLSKRETTSAAHNPYVMSLLIKIA